MRQGQDPLGRVNGEWEEMRGEREEGRKGKMKVVVTILSFVQMSSAGQFDVTLITTVFIKEDNED